MSGSGWAGVPAVVMIATVAALFLDGCTRCEAPREFESFVSVPTTIEAVDARNRPPEVTVSWERETNARGSSGSGCAHSPVCLIVLPFVLAEALFPEKLRVAKITEGGREVYHGAFRENGQFLQALALQDGTWRKIAFLELSELSRNVVVEIAHAGMAPDGQPGPFTRSELQAQVDLLGPYGAAFASAEDAGARQRLVGEMLHHLEDEALPFVSEAACDTPSHDAVGVAQEMRAFAARPRPDGKAPGEHEVEAALSPLFDRCASEERTLLLRSEVGLPLTPEQLSVLAKSADPFVASRAAITLPREQGTGSPGTAGAGPRAPRR